MPIRRFRNWSHWWNATSMSSPATERVLAGSGASVGLVIGRIVVAAAPDARAYCAGPPTVEAQELDDAVAKATAQLEALIETSVEDEADILSFQTALLEDDALHEPVRTAIDSRDSAPDAWTAAMDAHIAEYRAADDDYFRARADDLTDLKDRVMRCLLGVSAVPQSNAETGEAVLLAMEEMTPSQFVETDWTRVAGVALARGSASGHVAILARARGVPMLIGLGDALNEVAAGALAILDAEAGNLVLHPDPSRLKATTKRIKGIQARAAAEARYLEAPARTGAGEAATVMINVDNPLQDPPVGVDHCDGIGLTRSEFLFYGHGTLPDEETQYRCYRRLVEWASGRPVTIRTLDAGGDKPIEGLTPEGESNPFLGLRGLRLSLQRPEVFGVQLRALARAAVHGPLKVMVPMVTAPWELEECRSLLLQAVADLEATGVSAALLPLGMMVEVPAAALRAEAFDADFYSIGSNDLIQYVMAAGRDTDSVARLYDPFDPAVGELIRRVVAAGRKREVEVSLCGDMASDPVQVQHLLMAGMRTFSVAPSRLAAIKAAIAGFGADEAVDDS